MVIQLAAGRASIGSRWPPSHSSASGASRENGARCWSRWIASRTVGSDADWNGAVWSATSRAYRPSVLHQLGVGALLDQPPVVQHEDQVGVDDRLQPVGHLDDRLLGVLARRCSWTARCGRGVQRRGRLVEDQQRRLAQQRPRQRDPLPLPAREPDAALADDRVVAVGKLADDLVGDRRAGPPGWTSSSDAVVEAEADVVVRR